MEEQNKNLETEVQVEKLAFSLKECAQSLGIGEPLMLQLAHSEGFPTIKIGKRIIVPVKPLDKWLLEHSGIKEF